MISRQALSVLAFVVSASIVTPVGLAAQASSVPPRVRVALVLSNATLHGGSEAFIIQDRRGPTEFVIMLPANGASARQVSAAVFAILALPESARETASRREIRVSAANAPGAWIETEERAAEGILRKLAQTEPRYLPPFGTVRYTFLSIPARSRSIRPLGAP